MLAAISTQEIRAFGRVDSAVFPQKGWAPLPVSYTHLRAHETVLDIVCRLLLEKKKTMTMQTHLLHRRTRIPT